jgi:CcmD family protein
MAGMSFMMAAYAVFWILTFVFIFSIFNRQRNLRRDLELIEQLLESQEKAMRSK